MRNQLDRVGASWSLARAVLLLSCFLATASAAVLGIFLWLDRSEIEIPDFGLNAVAMLQNRLAGIGDDPSRIHVAFLGDSTVVSYPPAFTVPVRLEEALRPVMRGIPSKVHSLALPGIGPFEYYYASRSIREKRPDVVVLAFNPACLADAWGERFSRPQVAGLLKPAQIPRALTLPLHFGRVTTDRLLLYVAAIQFGGFDAWHWLAEQQSRIASAHKASAVWISAAIGREGEKRFESRRMLRRMGRYRVKGRNRFTEWAIERHYGVMLEGRAAGHPALEMLDAAIHELESSNVSTLTYTVPINLEHFDSFGQVDRARLQANLDAIERTVRGAGGDYLDLHDLFPDKGFRDGAGHFTIAEGFDGPALVATALRDRVASRLDLAAGPN